MSGIRENVERVREGIKQAAQRVGGDPHQITLVCVTKTVDAARIDEALGSTITDIGESRIQEAEKKFGKLSRPAKWHLVGHLQRNKAKDAVRIFDLIHSVDSLRLAEEIDKQAKAIDKTIDVLIQVNTSGERSKFGILPLELFGLIDKVRKLPNLKIRGLMTMAPLVGDPEVVRPCFRRLKVLSEEVRAQEYENVSMDYLSMGMTQDYEVAIEEGANMVRIGTAIFK